MTQHASRRVRAFTTAIIAGALCAGLVTVLQWPATAAVPNPLVSGSYNKVTDANVAVWGQVLGAGEMDDHVRITSIEDDPAASGGRSVQLTYDRRGLLETSTDSHAFAHDPGGRLLSSKSGSTVRRALANSHGDLTSPITLNRYTYANGSPLDYFDPSGHFGLPKFITNIARSIGNAITSAVSNAVSTVSNAVSSAGRNISSQYSSARQAIGVAARSLQQGASRFGDDLSAGVDQLSFNWKDTTSRLSATFDTRSLHTALDVAGFIPVVGDAVDGANAALYLLEGDTANALISMAAMVPVVGGAVTSVRLGAKSDNFFDAVRTPRGLERGENAIGMRPFTRADSRGQSAAKKLPEAGDTVLYQKLSSAGEHLKYGITKNPATRYTSKDLDGGSLNILARGPKQDMLALERSLHDTLPIGPQEGQLFYIQKQIANGLRPPPYPW